MPRQSRSSGRSAPSRPTIPARAAPTPMKQQQTRPATTYAAPPSGPPSAAPPAATASQGPGLMGQMASTAAGVAIGSSIGHVVGNSLGGLFGGGSTAAEPTQATQAQSAPQQQTTDNCSGATEQFMRCMDEQSGNMQICGWYLEQMKACQAAARQY